uniref:B30.2/SPRY domain-containing protein n=1 Tax=Oryzias melastigma TaxID=30732 RepID=A0A3B3BFM5_ORYME
ATNKAAAGEFSEPVALETRASESIYLLLHVCVGRFHPVFCSDRPLAERRFGSASGSNAVFFSRSSTPSPSKTAGGRAGRERFAGEAYTVLGRAGEVCGGCHYWELRPSSDWKSFSVGVAYRGSLGRYEQLGKSSASWCLFASQWLQTALAAKHNNRARSLEWPLPQRIGIYCDYDNGTRTRTASDSFNSIQFNFIYIAQNHKGNLPSLLLGGKTPKKPESGKKKKP